MCNVMENFTPKITRRSQSLERHVEDLIEWQRNKNLRLQESIEKRRQEEERENEVSKQQTI